MFVGEKASKQLTPGEPMRFEDNDEFRSVLDAHVLVALAPLAAADAEPLHYEGGVASTDSERSGRPDASTTISGGAKADVDVQQAGKEEDEEDDEAALLPDYAAAAAAAAPGDSDDDSDDGDDSDDSSSSLEPVGLDDDRRDLVQAKRPHFLRDCIKAIGNTEDYQVGGGH
jgi:hypothetical protein